MSGTVKKAISLMEMLPESGQNFALEFIRKLDFTKVTPAERNALEKAEKDMKENGTVPHDSINWD
jgi:alkyl hydroperoxide reductase subunit AhpC